jgi:hypothetical protein
VALNVFAEIKKNYDTGRNRRENKAKPRFFHPVVGLIAARSMKDAVRGYARNPPFSNPPICLKGPDAGHTFLSGQLPIRPDSVEIAYWTTNNSNGVDKVSISALNPRDEGMYITP